MNSSRVGRVGRVLMFASLIASCHSNPTEQWSHETKPTGRGIHIPIVRRLATKQTLGRRAVTAGSIGLGDFEDVTYNVQVQIGDSHLPLVLDTGSSDLWVLSTACQGTCQTTKVPLYPQTQFRPTNMNVTLKYGDSMTGTHATGAIGSDAVAVAGVGLSGQYFAAIRETNTSVVETGSAGIFGLGFPINSVVWTELLLEQRQAGSVAHRDIVPLDAASRSPEQRRNLASRWFWRADDDDEIDDEIAQDASSTRQVATTSELQSSFETIAPLIPRLVAQGVLDSPMFSVTLQRDTIDIGGNEGMLSIGELPPTVNSESLTWVDVRRYSPTQGGLSPPSDAPGEVYPVAWEIPLDDVWFDGFKLPRSQLSAPNISLSALVDTGNSLIRGPSDVIAHILAILGGPRFACSPPHVLEFEIGGKLFPVDPRDFISEVHPKDPDLCIANLAPTDAPVGGGAGYLYSWNLGDPFLKSVLAAFHYGSLVRPSQNPPRVGLLSTVDVNAGKQLCDDKHKAQSQHDGYPMIIEPAPASLPPSRGTGLGGVPLAALPSVTQSGVSWLNGGMTDQVNGVRDEVRFHLGIWTALAGVGVWVAWRVLE